MHSLPHGRPFRATQNSILSLFIADKSTPVAGFDPATQTLTKSIDFTRHIVQKPRAIAFDVRIVAQAVQLNAKKISVTDTNTNDVWTIEFADFQRLKRDFNRGYGSQLMVTLNYWQRNGQPSEATQHDGQAAVQSVQLALFDTPTAPNWLEVYK